MPEEFYCGIILMKEKMRSGRNRALNQVSKWSRLVEMTLVGVLM